MQISRWYRTTCSSPIHSMKWNVVTQRLRYWRALTSVKLPIETREHARVKTRKCIILYKGRRLYFVLLVERPTRENESPVDKLR